MTAPTQYVTDRNGKRIPYYVSDGIGVTKNTIYPFHLIKQVGDFFAWRCDLEEGKDTNKVLTAAKEKLRVAARRIAPDKRFRFHAHDAPFLDENMKSVPSGVLVECIGVGKPVAAKDVRGGGRASSGDIRDKVTLKQLCAYLEVINKREFFAVSPAFTKALHRLVSESPDPSY